jgi:membrane fusion protein (multidrug efflux system)
LQYATIGEQSAEVRAAAAEVTRSGQDQKRYRELVKDDAVSNQIVERATADVAKARAALDRSNASLLAAQRQIAVLDAQIGDATARVATAKAAQRVAALNVEYTIIRSPIDGYVGNRTARVGMLANTGVSLLTVVPAGGLWVDANFKEDQLKKMRAGDSVEVSLDAASGVINGVVESVAPATGATFSVLPAENATGNFTKIVQRVPVRIRLSIPKNSESILRAGLSATVKVHLDSEHALSRS